MEDGMVDITLGVQWLFLGSIFQFGETPFGLGAALAIWTGISLWSVWKFRSWKGRVVAPRTGYVALPMSGGISWRSAAPLVLCLAPVLAIPRLGVATGFAGMVAAYFVWLAWECGIPRYLAVAAVALAAGAGGHGIPFLLMAVGAAFAGAGGLRLAIFLSAHPRQEPAE
jgi:hypothetical protein